MNIPFFNTLSNRNRSNVRMILPNKFQHVEPIAKPPIQLSNVSTGETTKKMKWGEPTWYLFHTLARKVKSEDFMKIRIELLQNIVSICSNLPCPLCANHAKEYIKQNGLYLIVTKQGLIDFFYKFHNEVNKNKDVPLFEYDQLEIKYNSANTVNIIQNFMIRFQDGSRNIKLIADDLYRKQLTRQLKDWFRNNIQSFDL
jgi:hypothetical protein